MVVGSTVVVYSAATSDAVGECKHDARVNSACFTGGEGTAATAVATCADDKTIRFFRAEGGTLLVTMLLFFFSRVVFDPFKLFLLWDQHEYDF